MEFDKSKIISHYKKKLTQQESSDEHIVDWHSKNFQNKLFDELMLPFNLNGSRILDIGCGVGSLIDYLNSRGIRNFEYLGIDVVPHMIELCQKKHPEHNFKLHDIINQPLTEKYDWVIMSGTFGIKQKDHYIFRNRLIQAAYDACRQGVLFNMLSSQGIQTSQNLQLDQLRDYSDPMEVLKFCTLLSPKINYSHSYVNFSFAIHLLRPDYPAGISNQNQTEPTLIDQMLEAEQKNNYAHIIEQIHDDETDFRLILLKARILFRQGNKDAAFSLFETNLAKKLPPSGKITATSSYLFPLLPDQALIREWLALYSINDLVLMEKARFLKDIQLLPQTAFRSYYLALLALHEKEFSNAAELFKKTLNKHPNLLGARKSYAFCLFQLKDYPGAQRNFLKVLKLEPTCNFSLNFYVKILRLKGQESKVRHFLRNYPQSEQIKQILATH